MVWFSNNYVFFTLVYCLLRPPFSLGDGNAGLFEQNKDQVLILNGTNLDSYLRSATKQTAVLFYSAMCGHCQRFKKPFADAAVSLQDMRSKVVIAAINCVPAGNRQACDKHQVHGYPTTKLFKPFQANLTGRVIENLQVGATGQSVASKIGDALFKDTSLEMNWDEFLRLKNGTSSSKQINNIVLIDLASNKNNILGNAVALFAVPYKYTDVHHVNLESGPALESAKEEMKRLFSKSEILFPLLVRVSHDRRTRKSSTHLLRSGEKDIFVLAKLMRDNMRDLYQAGPELKDIFSNGLSTHQDVQDLPNEEKIQRIITSRNTDLVYAEDLVSAVYYALTREVPVYAPFESDALDALKKFLTVLTKFFPRFDETIHARQNMSSVIRNTTQQLLIKLVTEPPVDGEAWKEMVTKIYKNVSGLPQLPPERWVNCLGSKPNFRGYPCGVWTLFHVLQVSAYEQNPEDTSVLTAMVGFIGSFFSCLDCRANFEKESVEYKTYLLDGKTSITYLWRLHNNVNKRLSGDITEDPTHKKSYFPTYQQCKECYLSQPESTPVVANGTQLTPVEWNERKVVKFLRGFYGVNNMLFYYTREQAIFSFAPLTEDRKKSLLLNAGTIDSDRRNYFSMTDVLLLISVYVASVGCILAVCYYFQRRNIQRCRGTNNKVTRYAFA